jgi:microcystin degradation protein MlrC
MLTVPMTTLFGPAAEIKQLCLKVENEDGIIACTFFHGFPYVDRPNTGSAVLVVAEKDRKLAESTGRRVAQAIWDMRERLRPNLTDAPTAIARALREARWPTVLLDSADNPGGMAPGDSTHLLKVMIGADLKEACFASINDREVAAQAHSAGRGSRIQINLGGKSLPLNGKPISAEATVLSLSDGRFQVTNPEGAGTWTELGPCAALQIGGIEVLVSSKPYQPYDPGLFKLHGIDVTKRKLVVLKSTSKWRTGFEGLIAQDIVVDTPGYMSRDLSIYEWHQLERPVWPLDLAVSYPASGRRG